MKTRWIAVLVLVLVAAVIWSRDSKRPAQPDQKLVGHISDICKIAERGIESPYKGVQKLFSYYGQNTPNMFKEWGELLVTIERIKDDKAHDERARLAGRRLHNASVSCERTFERFGLAIENDPKASKLLERGTNRLGRTLELIFSGGAASSMSFLPGFDSLLSTGEAN